ncbi:unnamed protein product [Psylliodes chrysocephalus]|uniref:HAT C-terminal dimerisation domain-containing protein n=1 Tax=Psylliodes chrysocephalus TaxID=3402493 RepID=A0A9P0CEC3_9CUCU|nr:unnamed protein product [Psylliodes chrysocephala]
MWEGNKNFCKISKESIGGTKDSSDPSVAETPKTNVDEDEEMDFSKNEDFNEKDGASSILSERSATPTSGVSSLSFANATFTQKRIDDTFAEIGSFKDGMKSILITNKILYMIVKDNLPLNTTETSGFVHFMKRAVLHYKIPGRTTITHLLDNKYDLLRNLMKNDLSLVKHLSVTADVWTDTLNTISFLGATVHFIRNGKFTNIALCLEELDERHTAEFLKEKLVNVFNECNIKISKITAIITDNGANIVKAGGYSKHSVAAADELRKLTHLKLIQSVSIRWNSTFFMLERFLKIRAEVSNVLLKFPKAPRMLTGFEFNEIEEVVKLLQPLEVVSKKMCGDKYATASKVIPVVSILQQHILDLDFQTESAKKLQAALLEQLQKRFGKMDEVHLLAIATLLDTSNAISKMKRLLETNISHETQEPENKVYENIDLCTADQSSIWSYHKRLVQTSTVTQETENNELKHYLTQKVIDIKEDPIDFWNKHKFIYPMLSCIAFEHLSIVATSVPAERMFSKARVIMKPHRNRLLGSKLSKLVYLNTLSEKDWHF